MQNVYKIVVGDWSNDGHNQSVFLYFRCNLTEAEIKEAYLKSVASCGVGLHRPGKELHADICTEYEDRYIPLAHKESLEAIGVDFTKVGGSEIVEGQWGDFGSKGIGVIFLELVKANRPDFVYELVEDPVPCINGFWSNDFNHSFGYGMFE